MIFCSTFIEIYISGLIQPNYFLCVFIETNRETLPLNKVMRVGIYKATDLYVAVRFHKSIPAM